MIRLLLLLCLASLNSWAQNINSKFDGKKWNAPYTLVVPEGWRVERFLIPIDFAPQILYNGVEDLRFTPGWADTTSNEYWSYAFLWYLDGKPLLDEKILTSNLTDYYNGLVNKNIKKRNIPAEKVAPTKVSINKVKTGQGDIKTYRGTIELLDYMRQKPISLNCSIHLKSCSEAKTFVFYELSPKPMSDSIWQSLNRLWIDFSCKENNLK